MLPLTREKLLLLLLEEKLRAAFLAVIFGVVDADDEKKLELRSASGRSGRACAFFDSG